MAEAARLFRAVLAADPSNVEALTGLAEEAMARGSWATARPLLDHAAAVAPREAGTFAVLARLHAAENRPDEAETCILTAIALAPHRLDYRIQGAALRAAAGDVAAALAGLEALREAWPADAGLLAAVAAMQSALGRLGAARANLQEAVALGPAVAAHRLAYALVLIRLGDKREARMQLMEALDLAPTDAAAGLAMAELLLDEGDDDAAERLARQLLLVAPGVVELTCLRARALGALGRTDEASALLARTARAAPDAAAPLLTLADLSLAAGRTDDAATFATAAAGTVPGTVPGAAAGAAKITRLGAAGLLLRAGRLAAGWEAMAAALPEHRTAPGRVLHLLASDNLADTLFFVRFCPALAKTGGCVRLYGAPALAGLLARVPGLAMGTDVPDRFDGDLLLLGAALGGSPEERPPPPLCVPEADVRAWRDALAPFPRPWTAIAWGGPTGLELERACEAAPAGGTLVSVVTGAARRDLSAPPPSRADDVVDAGGGLRTYPAMAALLAAVDGVVLPDGPAAHLAGALGCSGTVFAPPGGHLAWAAPWYPSLLVRRGWARDAVSGMMGELAEAKG